MHAPRKRSLSAIATPYLEHAEYVECIRKGIPKAERKKNIAVVGAGMAGLVSATLLAEAGHNVTIFEASARIGGRVFTVRQPFSHGLYSEGGAMRLPSFYNLTLEYISKFQLPTNPFLNHDKKGNEYIYVNGVKQRRSQYLKNKARGLKYPLLDIEQGITAEDLLANALQPIATYVGKEPLEGWQFNRWRDVVNRYGEYTVRDFLKTQTFYSEGAIEMIEVLMDLESRSEQALIQQIVEINDHGADVDYVEISGGMDQLPNAFLPRLRALNVPIQFDQRLIEIDQLKNDKVKLRFEKGMLALDASVTDFSAKEFEADEVIVTVPFPGFRYVKVNPLLSHNKRKAIRELNYDASTKILLQFKSRFWEKNDDIYGGCTITDLPCRFIYYPSHGFDGSEGGVLTASYTWGDEARGWDSLTRPDQIRNALDNIAEIHGDYVKTEFVSGFIQSWAIDPFSNGEAAMFYGGQLEELQPYIPTPEGNIHFAGEHTSLKHAWIEGAVESGIRVALEIARTAQVIQSAKTTLSGHKRSDSHVL